MRRWPVSGKYENSQILDLSPPHSDKHSTGLSGTLNKLYDWLQLILFLVAFDKTYIRRCKTQLNDWKLSWYLVDKHLSCDGKDALAVGSGIWQLLSFQNAFKISSSDTTFSFCIYKNHFYLLKLVPYFSHNAQTFFSRTFSFFS